MVTRVTLILEPREYQALYQAAKDELRIPSSQARYWLRAELERRGLLEPGTDQETKAEVCNAQPANE